MKRELAYVELIYLVKEFQTWIGARISRITVVSEQCSFELFKTGGKKTVLNFIPPLLWIGEYKVKSSLVASSLTLQLRKLLEGSVIRNITLVKGERMVLVDTEKYRLVFQLFGKGNMFVLERGVVIAVLHQGSVSGVKARVGLSFVIEEKADPQERVPAVPTLEGLLKLGLGKLYAQEALLSQEVLSKAVQDLFLRKIQPCVVTKDAFVIDVTPYALQVYAGHTKEEYSSFNAALDAAMLRHVNEIAEERVRKSFSDKLERARSAIAAQEIHLEHQKSEVVENQACGELLYENYVSVKEVLNVLREARKKFSWEDIKKRVGEHPFIKEIDEKKGLVVLELQHA